MGALQQKGADSTVRRELASAAKSVGGSVAGLLACLQVGNRGWNKHLGNCLENAEHCIYMSGYVFAAQYIYIYIERLSMFLLLLSRS